MQRIMFVTESAPIGLGMTVTTLNATAFFTYGYLIKLVFVGAITTKAIDVI